MNEQYFERLKTLLKGDPVEMNRNDVLQLAAIFNKPEDYPTQEQYLIFRNIAKATLALGWANAMRERRGI